MKKAIISTILILAMMTFANSHVEAGSIRLTDIPDYGTQHDLLKGKVEGTTTPTDYKVAVYILIDGMGWYVKPYTDSFVFPDLEGNWTCNIVTGGVDQYAVKITAYLLPGDYSPPERSRETDAENAIDKATATRSAKIISFSGYDWAVKSSVEGTHSWPVGPGQNYFSASSENVWVDEQGDLHLKITKKDGKWYCAEVRCLEEFGYGTYHFYLSSGFEPMINQNENVVLGLFTYDDEAPPPYREMTIEYSKWGDPEAANGQFIVQPHDTFGNKRRFTFPYTGQDSKHSFKWSKDEIGFEASYDGTVAESWTYTGNDVPDHGDETVRINLWLCDDEGLGEQSEVEIIIERFEFVGKPVEVTMDLPAGWSMISLPVKPEPATVTTLFPGAVVVYGFEKSFGYVRKQALEVGKGYWIFVNEPQSYTLTGQPIESYTIPIDADGWLMIGGCIDPAQVIPHGCNIVVIYGYVQGIGYQRVPGHLERGKGYWILLNNVTSGPTISVETVDFIGCRMWTAIGPGGGGGAQGIAIHPEDPNIVFSVGDTGIIYKSIDGGDSWSPANKGMVHKKGPFLGRYTPLELHFHPRYPNRLLGFWNNMGLFLSDDGGETWIWDQSPNVVHEYPSEMIVSMTVDPDSEYRVFYYSTLGNLYISEDGITGTLLAEDLGEPFPVKDIAFTRPKIAIDMNSPFNNRRLFVATNEGVYVSNDHGRSWNVFIAGLPQPSVSTIATASVNGNTIVYCTIGNRQPPFENIVGGLFRSDDLGQTWIKIGSGLPTNTKSTFSVFKIHPQHPHIMYIGSLMYGGSASGADIYKSVDGGETFQRTTFIGGENHNIDTGYYYKEELSKAYLHCHAQCLDVASSSPDIVFAWNGWWGMVKTIDGGKTWSNASTERLQARVVRGRGENIAHSIQTAIAPDDSNTLFLGLTDEGTFMSTDGGATMTKFFGGSNTTYEIYTMKDIRTGEYFDPEVYPDVYAFLGETAKLQVTGFSFDPLDSDILYISTGQRLRAKPGIVAQYRRSTDETWLIGSSLTGLPKQTVSDIKAVREIGNENTVLLAAVDQDGIFTSVDGGMSWYPSNDGIAFGQGKASRFIQHPVYPHTLFVLFGTTSLEHWDLAGKYGGIYQSSDDGNTWEKIFPLSGFADVRTMLILPDNPQKMFIGVIHRKSDEENAFLEGGVYFSNNGGEVWERRFDCALPVGLAYDSKTKTVFVASAALPTTSRRAIEIDFFGMDRLMRPGLFASGDMGNTWIDVTAEMDNISHSFINITLDAVTRKIYLGGMMGTYMANIDILLRMAPILETW